MRVLTNSHRWCWLVLAAACALAGCTSRTLPLPPPEVNQVSEPGPDGFVLVEGRAREGASVGVLNDATLEGTVVTSQDVGCASSCEFSARVEAASGDPIRVWQFYETENSVQREVP